MASERDEPAGAGAKAWRRHVERLRRPGSPAMMPPRRGKGRFGPMDGVARLPDSPTIGPRSLLATNQISPCHGRGLSGVGPLSANLPPERDEDTQLCLRAAGGDRRAFSRLVARHENRLRAFLARLAG